MISIIIRTKNEERWITSCLRGVFKQRLKEFEVILVDNQSTDNTIEKASQFDIKKVVACENFYPGLAINMGVRESEGEYIVCLSGHCIPTNDRWLENLLRNFNDKGVAGVYGRQEPMSFTSDLDKRDLSIIFGLDRKVQIKDSFFHNANSMIRRDLWEKHPFNEGVTNIEDRVWAQRMLHLGHKIVYEPEAGVYHYHGIHQDGNIERCRNVVGIMENHVKKEPWQHLEIEKLNIVALIPVRGPILNIKDKPLLGFTIEAAKESKYVNKIVVSTDNPALARVAEEFGAEVPFLRDSALSEDYIDIERLLQYSLEELENLNVYPDLLVSLEITFPFRPEAIIDNMIGQLVENGLDTIIAARAENKSIWKEKEGKIKQFDEGITPRKFKDPTFIGLRGLCCVTHPEFLREGRIFGQKVGIYDIKNPFSHIEVREDGDFKIAEAVMESWEGIK